MDTNREEPDKPGDERIKELEQQLAELREGMDAAMTGGDFERAADIREQELPLKVELSALCPDRDILDARDKALLQSAGPSRLDLLEAKIRELEGRLKRLEGNGA